MTALQLVSLNLMRILLRLLTFEKTGASLLIDQGGFEQSLQRLIKKLDKSDLPRLCDIVFNFVGEKPMRVALTVGSKTSIHRTLAKEAPRLEISGDPERIQAILAGKKDPKLAFLEGLITVRGDIDYLQSVLRSLDLMD